MLKSVICPFFIVALARFQEVFFVCCPLAPKIQIIIETLQSGFREVEMVVQTKLRISEKSVCVSNICPPLFFEKEPCRARCAESLRRWGAEKSSRRLLHEWRRHSQTRHALSTVAHFSKWKQTISEQRFNQKCTISICREEADIHLQD